MAQREKDLRIQQLYDDGLNVYSFSRLNTIDNCLLDAYYSYIKHDRGAGSAYTYMGTKIHDTLQGIMEGTATVNDLLPALQSELDDLDMVGIDFPRDFRGGTSIRDKWIANMSHFCKTFKPLEGNFKAEELLILTATNNRAIIGYADVIRFNDDGTISIIDYKTSSWFKPEDIVHHGRQFVAYTLAAEQMGYVVRDCGWLMLKYVQITYTGKARANSANETLVSKVCDRCKIYDTIQYAVLSKLDEAGIDLGTREVLMESLRKTNTLDAFPLEIQEQFKIEPAFRSYEVTQALKDEFIRYFDRIASKFEHWQSISQEEDKPWPAVKIDRKNSFFCNNLCSHRKICPALRDYLSKQAFLKASHDDLF